MVSSVVNSSGISIGSDGKITFSGVSSGIDSKSIIDAQIAAKRIPADNIEAKISANTLKAEAYASFKSKTAGVAGALDLLRGSSGLSSTNVFKLKTASGTTEPATGAPADHVPSDITSILSASVEQSAGVGSHTLVVHQLAKAHQIRGDAVANTTTALGLSGDFDINGMTVTLAASDSLLDVRSKINTLSATTNVVATIVSSSATESYLVLTSSKTGEDFQIDLNGGNAITDSLGLTDGSGAPGGDIKTQLRAAQNAILDVNGVTGIERNSNQINDILEGITLSLTKAEPNTEVSLVIEPNLNAVKSAIVDFVSAYNELRAFAAEQRTEADHNGDGVVDKNELGPLAYDSTVRTVLAKLSELAAATVADNQDGYRGLGQIGITVNANYDLEIDDAILDARLISDVGQIRRLFAYETTVSDARVTMLGRTSDTQSGTYYLNIAGTDGDGNVTTANIQTSATTGNGGADDGSVSVNGQILSVQNGNAKGLEVFFDGAASLGSVDDIQITVSRGLADSFYNFFNDTVKNSSGTLDTLIFNIQSENERLQARVESIDARLEVTRGTLEAKYTAMEVALAQLQQLRSTITSYFQERSDD